MKLVISVSAAFFLLLLSACKKNDDDTRQSQQNDPAKYLFITTIDDHPTIPNYALASLNAYNPDLTLKWRKQAMGNGEFSGFWVEDGVVYASIGYNLYALNYSTGVEIWSKIQSTEYYYSMAKKDDTLYCSTAAGYLGGNLTITAYRASTGTLIWKKPLTTAFGATYLTVDGNTLYYGAAVSQLANHLYAMDLTTQNIKWSVPLGANINGVYSMPVFNNNKVFIKNSIGTMLAIDKANGNIAWSKTGLKADPPVLTANNKTVISAASSAHEMYGFNADNGNQLWIQKGSQNGGVSASYMSSDGENCYFTGWDGVTCLIKQNAATGNTIWRQNYNNYFLKFPISAGDKAYMIKIYDQNYGHTLMSFDAASGVLVDSLRMTYRSTGVPSIVTSSGKYIKPWFYQ